MADHIQIGDISPRIQYTANGTDTVFTFPFPIFDDEDIEVFEDTIPKALTTDYTVTGAGESSGGSVTFLSAPSVGAIVTLRRNIAIERTTDFQESGDLRASVLNSELDKIVAGVQQVETDLDRSLRLSTTDSFNTSLDLPDKATRSSKVLTFDANGDPAASTMDISAIESGATDAAASAAAALASETAAAGSAAAALGSQTASAASATSAASSSSAAAISAGQASTSETNASADAASASADATSTAADALATAADAASTAADAASTSADAVATAADAIATAVDAASTAADAVNTNSDKMAAAASATAAAAAAASGLYSAVQEKSANYTVVVGDMGDLIKVDATSGPLTITLDQLSTLGVDSKFAIQKIDASANAVTIACSGADTINGGASITLQAQWELFEVIGDTSSGLWTAINMVASGLTGGDGIGYSGGTISADLLSGGGLEISSAKIRTTDSVRSMDMPFNAGYGPQYLGENIAVQQYGAHRIARSGVFSGDYGGMVTAPVGSALIMDVLINGTTIFTTKPQFASGSTNLTNGVLNAGAKTFAAGDLIEFKVTQVGASTPGQKMTYTVKAEVS